MFLKEVSYAHQSCIYFTKTYSKNSNIVKYYYHSNRGNRIMIG